MVNNSDSKLFYLVVGNNIKKYRSIRNFSLQDLAERVGLTKKTIQRYENGEIKIDMDRLYDISIALDVEMPQLIEGAESFLGVSLDDLNSVKVPIVESMSYKNDMITKEEVNGYEETPRSWIKNGSFFYIRANDDSMINARIYAGDLLLIREQNEVEDGELAAVLIDGKVCLKRAFKSNGILVLQSENTHYGPIFVNDENKNNIKIIGKLERIIINI